MATSSSSRVPASKSASERALETSELIERLATEMRAASNTDLPHAYFVEQVKLQLAGLDPNDRNDADIVRHSAKVVTAGTTSVFHSWALPDT